MVNHEKMLADGITTFAGLESKQKKEKDFVPAHGDWVGYVASQILKENNTLKIRRGSTVPAQATDDDLHAAAAVPHAAGAGPAGRPRDAAGVRAAGGGAAAGCTCVVVDAARVPGFRAEASRGRGGLAPRLILVPPFPIPLLTTNKKTVGFTHRRGGSGERGVECLCLGLLVLAAAARVLLGRLVGAPHRRAAVGRGQRAHQSGDRA